MTEKRFDTHCISETGPACKVNEDSYAVLHHNGPGGSAVLVAVADGVGGLDLGEDASRAVIEALCVWWDKLDWACPPDPDHLLQEMTTAIRRANHTIFTAATRCKLKMGTTLSALLLTESEYRLYHIGDSRIYHIKNGTDDGAVEQLTTDHAKTMFARDGEKLKIKSYLTQCLGAREEFTCQKAGGAARPGDVFLVCTDGLYKTLSEEDIGGTMRRQSTDVSAVCGTLAHQALQNGERDNLTAAVVQVCM